MSMRRSDIKRAADTVLDLRCAVGNHLRYLQAAREVPIVGYFIRTLNGWNNRLAEVSRVLEAALEGNKRARGAA